MVSACAGGASPGSVGGSAGGGGAGDACARRKPIESLRDLRGFKIRVSGFGFGGKGLGFGVWGL